MTFPARVFRAAVGLAVVGVIPAIAQAHHDSGPTVLLAAYPGETITQNVSWDQLPDSVRRTIFHEFGERPLGLLQYVRTPEKQFFRVVVHGPYHDALARISPDGRLLSVEDMRPPAPPPQLPPAPYPTRPQVQIPAPQPVQPPVQVQQPAPPQAPVQPPAQSSSPYYGPSPASPDLAAPNYSNSNRQPAEPGYERSDNGGSTYAPSDPAPQTAPQIAPQPVAPYAPAPAAPYAPAPSPYAPTQSNPYTPAPTGPYTPAPTGPYTPAPTGPYAPAPTSPYTSAPNGSYAPAPAPGYTGGPADPNQAPVDQTDLRYEPAPADAVAQYDKDLGAYGHWVDTRDYGRCWVPNGVPGDWRPYTVGHWVDTDQGWTWVAEDREADWGAVTYHYGRWYEDPSYGWVWVPGTVWAPAWVAWREGDGYCGWAPLPPQCGIGINISIDLLDRWCPADRFVYCDERFVGEPHVFQHFERNTITLINRTTNITHVTYVNNRIVNIGVAVENVERRSGRRVERVELGQATSVADVRRLHEQGRPVVYAPPAIERASRASDERLQRVASRTHAVEHAADPRQVEAYTHDRGGSHTDPYSSDVSRSHDHSTLRSDNSRESKSDFHDHSYDHPDSSHSSGGHGSSSPDSRRQEP